jgi:hypothetical protein
VAKTVEAYVLGLNRLLRDLGKLPKEAQAELRDASQRIADTMMVPAWRAAAMQAGPWGPRLAESVRSKRDRIPAVNIGGNRRVFSGGASPTMVRFPSHAGRVRQAIPEAFQRTGWIKAAKPAYIGPAMQAWGDAVSGVCRDFNNGPDYR